MIYYFLQVVVFQAIFLLVYYLFFRKETFFNHNRAYLLLTSFLSLVLPLIKLESLRTSVPAEFSIQLPAVLIGEQTPRKIASINTFTQHISETGFVWHWSYILFLGMFVAALIFILKAFKLIQLYRRNTSSNKSGFRLVTIKKSNEAFSFFNLIFLGEHIKQEDRAAILQHELIHLKQGHSFDLLWFEVMRIFLWFNPCIYLFHKNIIEQHEFIADKKSLNSENKTEYYHNLLNQIFKTNNLSFVNHFYKNSLIKKRIVMMTKNSSSKSKLFKYLLIMPILLGMLIYTSCENEQIDEEPTINNLTDKIDEIKYRLINPENLNVEERRAMEELFVQYIKQRESLRMDKVVPEIKKTEIVDSAEVPFGVIDEAPLFNGCDASLSKEDKKKCTSDMIARFVNINFNTDLPKGLGLEGRQRINVIFKIDENGNVVNIRSRAPYPELEKEAARVVGMLPKFTPGKQDGKNVVVPYSLPIVFQIN